MTSDRPDKTPFTLQTAYVWTGMKGTRKKEDLQYQYGQMIGNEYNLRINTLK